jgi:hypothetical protein
MASNEERALDDALEALDQQHQILDQAPAESQLLGPFSIVCLFLNRTIGKLVFAF